MDVVFDFGAVLFSWRPADLLMGYFPERAGTHTEAATLAHAVFGHPDWHAFDQGLLAEGEVITRITTRLGLPRGPVTELVQGIGERLRPIPETVELLEGLRQRRDAGQGVQGLYFLSNMPLPYARELEDKHSFLGWFDGGLFSGDVKLIKPDPAIYLALQQRFALEPETTLFIDDLKANVRTAESLGWQAIHFEHPAQLAARLAELL